MIAKPCLGYPSRTAAVLAMLAEGFGVRLIADRIGVPPATVTALAASGQRAVHRRPGARTRRPAEASGMTVVVPRGTLVRLIPDAARREISVPELVRRLLDHIVDDGMVDAILDDTIAS